MPSLKSSAALLGLSLFSSTCLAQSDDSKWWQQPFGMLQTNLREIDADMDVDATADYILAHGASAWLTSVGGILANYPTELDYQIVNPYLAESRESGDLIQDTLDAARSRGIRLLGRMDFSKVQWEVAEAHPEWLYISPNGTWQVHTRDVVSVCPSGEWYQERVFDIMDEVIDRYKLDGFFVNWVGFNENDYFRNYHGVCHCDNCQRRWAEHAGEGVDLPDGPWNETYIDWRAFSNGIIDEWTDKMRDFIAERLPEAGLILGTAADVRFHESNFAIDRTFWPFSTDETVSKFASGRPEVPVLVNAASFLDHAYRITTVGPEHFVQFHLQAIARGARPSTYIIGYPGQHEWPGIDKAGEIMRFYKANAELYEGLKPVSKTGLVLPQSRQMNETNYVLADTEYKGFYKALLELHIPFDVIGQENLQEMSENGGLDRYSVLILPHLGELMEENAESLDDWTSSGGTLISAGLVGYSNDSDSSLQLQSLPASSLVDWKPEIKDTWSEYFAPVQNGTEDNIYEGTLIPLLGSYGQFEWKDDITSVWAKLASAPFAPPEYIYGQVQVNEEPGAAFAPHGDGQGVLIPFLAGSGYHNTGLPPFRDFIAEVIEEAGGAGEKYHFDLPQQVGVTVSVNAAEQTVVHLINHSGVGTRNYGAHLPLPAGSIHFSGDTEGVTVRTAFTGLELEIEDGVVQLPGLDLFDVIVIEGL